MEVEAFVVTARVWQAFWGDAAPARTALERGRNALTKVLATDGESGLSSLVAGNPGYQQECGL